MQLRGLPLWWQLSRGPSDYAAGVRETGRLDAAVLQAVANVLQLRILVVAGDSQHLLVPYQPHQPTRTIHLFLNNNHFLCYDKRKAGYIVYRTKFSINF